MQSWPRHSSASAQASPVTLRASVGSGCWVGGGWLTPPVSATPLVSPRGGPDQDASGSISEPPSTGTASPPAHATKSPRERRAANAERSRSEARRGYGVMICALSIRKVRQWRRAPVRASERLPHVGGVAFARACRGGRQAVASCVRQSPRLGSILAMAGGVKATSASRATSRYPFRSGGAMTSAPQGGRGPTRCRGRDDPHPEAAMSESSEGGRSSASETSPPGVDFTTLVLSLRQSTLLMLRLVEDEDAPVEPDLPGARLQIDLLEVLERKTRGNLDADEEKLLTAVLYELRMAWVEIRNRPQDGG
ncbi:MAG: DUF1844 domain-containing protein [Deltaproteobacteria bacterium]|nr:MAG: DUF1844 domain-containing protein [Deltaproteobacteria bacterium]